MSEWTAVVPNADGTGSVSIKLVKAGMSHKFLVPDTESFQHAVKVIMEMGIDGWTEEQFDGWVSANPGVNTFVLGTAEVQTPSGTKECKYDLFPLRLGNAERTFYVRTLEELTRLKTNTIKDAPRLEQ